MARVILTQPSPRVGAVAAVLRDRGHEVLEMPVRRLLPLTDEPAVRQALGQISHFDWVIFCSPGSVQSAWAAVPRPWPVATGVAVVGPGTGAALQALAGDSFGPSHPPLSPRQPEAPFVQPKGRRILVVRGETGREDWIEALRAAGAEVERVAVHRSEPIGLTPAAVTLAQRWLEEGAVRPVFCLFTAGDAIEGLSAALPVAGRDRVRALAVHPRLALALHKCGWLRAGVIEPGEAGLLAAIESGETP
ncbi:MAG: uroporphyrinogen-III synthase [Burkholderiales bacterium]|nr:uroporphyrinogen-III synthase [Burkholderiales bacterium]